MASPAFQINGGAVGAKASIAASTSFSATLDSTDGVRSCTWAVIGTDETTTAASFVLVQSGSVGQTVTLTSAGAGTAGILRCEINGGQDLQTEQASATTRATGKWYVVTAVGQEVGCVNEQMESDASFGWTGIINSAIRNPAGGGSVISSVTGTAPISVTAGVNPVVSIPAASASVNGYFGNTDKALLDTKTSSSTANSMMRRGASGEADLGYARLTASGTTAATGDLRMGEGSAANGRATNGNDATAFEFLEANGLGIGNDAASVTTLKLRANSAHQFMVNNVEQGRVSATYPLAMSVATLALMTALPTPVNNRIVWSAETRAQYKFDTSSSETANGWTILAADDATPGRWVIASDSASIAATGSAGDWSRLVNFVVACAAKGVTAIARSNTTWLCDAPPGQGGLPQWPSFSRLVFDDGASVHMTLDPSGAGGANANSAFYAAFTYGSNIAAFHASPTVGSNVLDVDMSVGTFSNGSWIILSDSNITNVAELLKIVKAPVLVSGSRYTVTVHRAVRFPWVASGTMSIKDGTPPEKIFIDFNGCEVSGTGHRVVELGACQRGHVRGLVVTRQYGSTLWGLSFDCGGSLNLLEDSDFDGGGVASGALAAMENNVDSVTRRVAVRNGANLGFYFPDCQGCSLENFKCENVPYGVSFIPGGTNDVHGHTDCQMSNGIISDSSTTGIYVQEGDRFRISDVTILRGFLGATLTMGVTLGPSDTKISNLHIEGCSSDALNLNASTTQAVNVVCKDIGGYAINILGSTARARITGLKIIQTVAGSGPWLLSTGAELQITGARIDHTYNGNWSGASTAWNTLRLTDVSLFASGTGTKTMHDMQGLTSGPRIEMTSVRLIGTWTYGVVANHSNSAEVWWGANVDLSVASGGYALYDSSAKSNKLRITANGTSLVTLSSQTPKLMCSSTAAIIATRVDNNGTPPAAAPLTYVTAANTGYFKSAASDTEPYNLHAIG
jgi:hypothetical protein